MKLLREVAVTKSLMLVMTRIDIVSGIEVQAIVESELLTDLATKRDWQTPSNL